MAETSIYDRPITDATLTIRVIKNFPYRTYKNVILHHLDLTALTAGELKELVKTHVQTQPGFKAYKTLQPDTLKLYTKAHGTKTNNLIINMEDKEETLMFRDDSATLASYGCEHETEISFFVLKDYEEFRANPEEKW
ncbi:hypothetical protein BZA05DRAFT_415715 [Tricharina praecox]|uniref:uncharacterized protein n=1 Tax=Tricharina praecox TaxID=43433 RepID=UPI00221EF8A8|nr:uncharacterized protein BZA05DRAFT_415715 [Tricharina praecox]KAI5857005.1 hypothetical protein BZA05DRAFT_415715 [Tricharina praecox]